MNIQQNLESKTFVAFCKQVNFLRRIAQSKVKMWGRQVCMPPSYLLKGQQFERQVCRLTCFCVEIPFPEQNWHVHPHREKLHVLQIENTNVNNLIKVVRDSFRYLQRRKDSKTWLQKTVLKISKSIIFAPKMHL